MIESNEWHAVVEDVEPDFHVLRDGIELLIWVDYVPEEIRFKAGTVTPGWWVIVEVGTTEPRTVSYQGNLYASEKAAREAADNAARAD